MSEASFTEQFELNYDKTNKMTCVSIRVSSLWALWAANSGGQ